MPHNPITLDLLRALTAIEKHGSFAAAADALHKVPSALTYTVQKVEQDLDLKLFDRSGHRARMTDAGHLLLNEGKRILEAIDALAISAKQVSDGWEPRFNLVFETVVDSALILPVIKAFNQVAPFVSVSLREESLSGAWQSLDNGGADLVITPSITEPTQHSYQTRNLEKIEMVLAVAPDHPVAVLPQPVSKEVLNEYKVVVIRDTSKEGISLTTDLAQNHNQFIVPNMTDKIKAQVAGLGIGYLPRSRVRDQLQNGTLIEIKTDKPAPVYHLMLAWHQGNQGRALAWFIDELSRLSINQEQ